MTPDVILTALGMTCLTLMSFAFVKFQCNQNTKDIADDRNSLKEYKAETKVALDKQSDKAERIEKDIMEAIKELSKELGSLAKQVSDTRHYVKGVVDLKTKELFGSDEGDK